MSDVQLEPWEREPVWLKLLSPILKGRIAPYLEEIRLLHF